MFVHGTGFYIQHTVFKVDPVGRVTVHLFRSSGNVLVDHQQFINPVHPVDRHQLRENECSYILHKLFALIVLFVNSVCVYVWLASYYNDIKLFQYVLFNLAVHDVIRSILADFMERKAGVCFFVNVFALFWLFLTLCQSCSILLFACRKFCLYFFESLSSCKSFLRSLISFAFFCFHASSFLFLPIQSASSVRFGRK